MRAPAYDGGENDGAAAVYAGGGGPILTAIAPLAVRQVNRLQAARKNVCSPFSRHKKQPLTSIALWNTARCILGRSSVGSAAPAP